MKKIRVFSLALCAIGALAFAACGTPASVAATGSSQSIDGGSAVVNPLVLAESLEALNKAVSVKMALPEDAKDATFHVLDKDIAQADFTVDGVQYTLRGTLRTEDIAGVYGELKDIGTFTVNAGDKTAAVKITSTGDSTDSMSVYKWSWDKANYTLICRAATKDAAVDAGTGKVANACATAGA